MGWCLPFFFFVINKQGTLSKNVQFSSKAFYDDALTRLLHALDAAIINLDTFSFKAETDIFPLSKRDDKVSVFENTCVPSNEDGSLQMLDDVRAKGYLETNLVEEKKTVPTGDISMVSTDERPLPTNSLSLVQTNPLYEKKSDFPSKDSIKKKKNLVTPPPSSGKPADIKKMLDNYGKDII